VIFQRNLLYLLCSAVVLGAHHPLHSELFTRSSVINDWSASSPFYTGAFVLGRRVGNSPAGKRIAQISRQKGETEMTNSERGTHMPINDHDVDPDYFDLIVQSVSLLSSIATLGASWLQLRKSGVGAGVTWPGNSALSQLRSIRRSFEDVFETLDELLAFLKNAFGRSAAQDVLERKPRFGAARIYLTPSEFQKVNPLLTKLGNSVNMLRSEAINLQASLAHHRPSGEDRIDFNLSDFDEGLNQILFESRSIGEAESYLRMTRMRAEDFIKSALRALQDNTTGA
jgi:hypothetical protein